MGGWTAKQLQWAMGWWRCDRRHNKWWTIASKAEASQREATQDSWWWQDCDGWQQQVVMDGDSRDGQQWWCNRRQDGKAVAMVDGMAVA